MAQRFAHKFLFFSVLFLFPVSWIFFKHVSRPWFFFSCFFFTWIVVCFVKLCVRKLFFLSFTTKKRCFAFLFFFVFVFSFYKRHPLHKGATKKLWVTCSCALVLIKILFFFFKLTFSGNYNIYKYVLYIQCIYVPVYIVYINPISHFSYGNFSTHIIM